MGSERDRGGGATNNDTPLMSMHTVCTTKKHTPAMTSTRPTPEYMHQSIEGATTRVLIFSRAATTADRLSRMWGLTTGRVPRALGEPAKRRRLIEIPKPVLLLTQVSMVPNSLITPSPAFLHAKARAVVSPLNRGSTRARFPR